MRLRTAISRSLLASTLLVSAACGGAKGSAASPDNAEPSKGEPAQAMASMVDAAVVVSRCPDQARMNSRQAQSAIRKLVEPCAGVPGGKAHFAATLLPGGNIELGAPDGDPAEGLVPTCVLKHRLRHKVLLRKPCMFDVQLEERTVNVTHPPATH